MHVMSDSDRGDAENNDPEEASTMLVLSRKPNEAIVIDGGIRITVAGIRGNQVRLGIEAPGSVAVLREELCIPAHAGTSEARKHRR
jgi:carbon storage regulator